MVNPEMFVKVLHAGRGAEVSTGHEFATRGDERIDIEPDISFEEAAELLKVSISTIENYAWGVVDIPPKKATEC